MNSLLFIKQIRAELEREKAQRAENEGKWEKVKVSQYFTVVIIINSTVIRSRYYSNVNNNSTVIWQKYLNFGKKIFEFKGEFTKEMDEKMEEKSKMVKTQIIQSIKIFFGVLHFAHKIIKKF